MSTVAAGRVGKASGHPNKTAQSSYESWQALLLDAWVIVGRVCWSGQGAMLRWAGWRCAEAGPGGSGGPVARAGRSTSGDLGQVVGAETSNTLSQPTASGPSPPLPVPAHRILSQPSHTRRCVSARTRPERPISWADLRDGGLAPRNPVRQPTIRWASPSNGASRPPTTWASCRTAGQPPRRFLNGPEAQPGHRMHEFKAPHLTHTSSRRASWQPVRAEVRGVLPGYSPGPRPVTRWDREPTTTRGHTGRTQDDDHVR